MANPIALENHSRSGRQSCPPQRATGLVGSMRALWRRLRAQMEDRAAFETVTRLNDEQLRDIGLSREDVDWARTLPLSINAGAALAERARARRREQWR